MLSQISLIWIPIFLGSSLWFSFGFAIAPTQAQTRLTGFKTTGRDMDGLQVSVGFLGGGNETVLWGDQPQDEAGGAFGSSWSLFQRGDTFKRPWLFEVDDARPINRLSLNAVPGNTVFDNVEFDFLTEGSKDGFPFTVVDGQVPTTVDYSLPIDISEGDLFGKLSLTWDGGFDGRLIFFADTDNGTETQPVTVAPPIEPPAVVEPPPVVAPPPPTPVQPEVVVESPELTSPPVMVPPVTIVEPPEIILPPVAVEPQTTTEPPELLSPQSQSPRQISEPRLGWEIILIGGTIFLLRRRLSNSTQS